MYKSTKSMTLIIKLQQERQNKPYVTRPVSAETEYQNSHSDMVFQQSGDNKHHVVINLNRGVGVGEFHYSLTIFLKGNNLSALVPCAIKKTHYTPQH